MLSIEDPPCYGLKSSSDDERDSPHKLDLSTLDLVHSKDNNPLPKFSIRDYVFCTRSKDIATNWPFSQRSLELCLKHGLKELLPPFHSADGVRNPSLAKLNGQSDLMDNKIACNSSGKGSSLSDKIDSVCNTSGGKGPCLEIEASALPIPSTDKSEAFLQRAFKKRESINQSSKKKCRTIMKSSSMPHPSTKQDIAANTPMVSEAMAVCPVCRVFSSSSNTTLNAHMDRCLSGESTTKWLGESKLIKHKIKPKRMRLMIDIYKTAAHFTLEDLDRRNGTNWTSNLRLPAEGAEVFADRNTQQPNSQETISDGPVYIDANGTKLRILSKSCDLSIVDSKGLDGSQPKKHTKGEVESKFLVAKRMKKKEKNQIQKQHDVFKHLPPGKKKSSEINKNQDRNMLQEETNAEEVCKKQLKDPDQINFSKSETIRGWVCSKRTGLTKKIDNMVDHPCSAKFVYAKHNSSSSGNCNVIQQSLSRSPNGYPSRRIIDMPPNERRMKFSMVESSVPRDRTRSLAFEALAEHGINQSSSDDTSMKDYAPSPSKRRVVIKSSPYRSGNHHTLISKSRKLLSLRKKLQPAIDASAPNSDFYVNRKSSATKKPKEFHMSESNKAVLSEPNKSQESMDASVVRTFKRSRGRISRYKEEALMKTSSRSTPISYLSDTEDTDGSSMLNGNLNSASDPSLSAEDSIDTSWRKVDVDLSSSSSSESESESEGLPIVGSSNSLNPGFKDPLYETEAPMLSSEADIFCGTVTPESMMTGQVCMMVDMDFCEGKANYMDEVDAIPIPGPPGCFLPSPGRMESDDLQGNSSLTSNRFQCSAECQELVDHSLESPAAISTTSTMNPSEKSSAVGLPMQDTLVSAYSDFVVGSSLPVPKANSGGGTDILGLYGLRSDADGASEFGSYKFRNDQHALDCQDSQLLRRRAMGSTLFSSDEMQMNRRLDTNTPAGHISLGGFVDTQVKFRDVSGDYESVGPATPVLRLMGKNLMVINKDENAVHKAPHLVSEGTFSCNQTETCDVQRHERDVRCSKGVGTAYMNPAIFSTGSIIHTDLTECLIHPENPGDGTRYSKVDSTLISNNNDCIVRKGGQSLVGIPVSMSSETRPYYLTERYKDARYNGYLFDAKSSIPSRSKWSQC